MWYADVRERQQQHMIWSRPILMHEIGITGQSCMWNKKQKL